MFSERIIHLLIQRGINCMIGFRKLPLLGAVLAGIAILASPCLQARADFEVQVYDDGVLQTGIFAVANNNGLLFYGSTTNFSISSGIGTSNNPGSQGGSNLNLASSEQISTKFGTTGGTHTIQIVLSENDWTAPTGTPLNLTSSAGGSFGYVAGATPGATDSVAATYQGFLDNTNTLFGMPVGGSTSLETASASLNSAGTASLVFNPPSTTSQVPGGVPFSITDVLTFKFTLAAGSGQDTAQVSASTVASLPEPASMMAALTAVPFLALGAWLRRRKQVAVA